MPSLSLQRLILQFALMIMLLTIAVPEALAQKQDLSFTSPDGRWEFIAKVNRDEKSNNAYAYSTKLYDHLRKKTYLEDPVIPNSTKVAFPQRIEAAWSPDSHYLAIWFYYGRIAHDVVVFEISGKKSRPSGWGWAWEACKGLDELHQFSTITTSFGNPPWLNNTDLNICLGYLSKEGEKAHQGPWPDTSYSLVIRFQDHTGTVIKKEKMKN